MLRISKLTDYGILLLVELARAREGSHQNARELAERTGPPAAGGEQDAEDPLRRRAARPRSAARRGATRWRESPQEISVAEIIRALEGPIALMECVAGPGPLRAGIQLRSARPVAAHQPGRPADTLERVTLAELAGFRARP